MKIRIPITIIVACLIFFGGYAALFIAPTEAKQGDIQRIFYFHVPVWTAMTIALSVACVSNIAWLVTRQPRWDLLGVASAEVGVICTTIGLATGMLWGKPVWGIWWTWDARLTSAFVLWLLYISYLLLRELLDDPQKRATLSAVFGIFAYLDLPIVLASTSLWRTQHPQPVLFGGSNADIDPTMLKVLMLGMIAVVCVMLVILVDRYRLEKLRFEAEELRLEIETRDGEPQPAIASSAKKGLP
jgi:heme exporter protein C